MKVCTYKTSVLTFENRKELASYFIPYLNAPCNTFKVSEDGKAALRELLKLALPKFVLIEYVTNGYGQLSKVRYNGQEIPAKTAFLNALNVVEFPYVLTINN